MTSVLGALWHVGIVVDDLDATARDLGATLGHSFTSVQEQEVTVVLGDRPGAPGSSAAPDARALETARVRWAATSGESPDWELIQAGSGLWSTELSRGQALHHLAYWSDDLEGDIARLRAEGYELEASGDDVEGRVRFAYLIAPGGIRLELGARHTQHAWDEWVSGRDYGLGIA
ncbi:VOC family protein [Herbiconiux sp. CPCC 203407]|uniref:VOC family protein n=1 Tax=Herbiconiux oxytropis TaxID=2970915 RepID=A0AA41XJJ3_9MICO|nr:VOC family protein [Herbiconiux oxytropis]MCS5722724.1 VOC family protein [Herbiconiux oxytropis]MCS5728023.1 VOC family protein [Herbiconiux oxytropis]